MISIKENFDTQTPQGKLMITVFQAFSQFERDIIVERTLEGLNSARARGKVGGRPKVDQDVLQESLSLHLTKGLSVSEVCKKLGLNNQLFIAI
ncbi:recombinase family protein [Enterococcus mundtii]|nr:recombinase family protein [Enterococcus mundtii]